MGLRWLVISMLIAAIVVPMRAECRAAPGPDLSGAGCGACVAASAPCEASGCCCEPAPPPACPARELPAPQAPRIDLIPAVEQTVVSPAPASAGRSTISAPRPPAAMRPARDRFGVRQT